jgi:hypothetical protein
MKKKYLALFFCLNYFFCSSQTISKINSLKTYCLARNTLPKLKNNNLEVSAFRNYLEITLKTPDEYVHREAYKAAAYYFAQTDTVLAFKYIKAAVSSGAEVKCINGVFTVSELEILQKLRYAFVKQNYIPAVYSFFENIHGLDQVYRTGNTTDRRKKMIAQDQLNQTILTQYIQKNNWPQYTAFDTSDCGYGIGSALGSMFSHWDMPQLNFLYKTMVHAARENKLPWFVPINVNNLCLSRKPFITGSYYNLFNWLFSYASLTNLKINIENQIDMADDFTISDIISMCFRTYQSTDILILTPSREFAKNKENCRQQLNRLRKALLFFGLAEWQVSIFDFENNNSSLPDINTPISYWNIHYGAQPNIISSYKDTWILDNEFSENDFNTLFK